MMPLWSVKKPYTVFVAVVLIVVLGIVSFTGMSTDLLPELNLPYLVVMTSYPGASPEEVEQSVTRPLESVLSTAGGLREINSISNENISIIMMEYAQQTNMDSATIELSGSIDLLADRFPDTVGRPMIMRISPDMLPVMITSVDMADYDLTELSHFVRADIIPQLERIDGMATVSAEGLLEEELQITLNQVKIDSLNREVRARLEQELDKTRDELEKAQSELQNGRDELDNTLPDQIDQLTGAGLEVSAGISRIESILAQESILQAEKAAFAMEKQAIDQAVDQVVDGLRQQLAGLVPDENTDELIQSLIQQAAELGPQGILDWLSSLPDTVADSIDPAVIEPILQLLARQTALTAETQNIEVRLMTLEAMKPDLEKGLAEARDGLQTIEAGKITLAIEMAAAKTTLEQGSQELENGLAELDNAREQALEQGDITSLMTPALLGQIIAAQNFSMPAGSIRDGVDQVVVKIGDAFQDQAELGRTLLFSMEPVGDIRLNDIADLVLIDNSAESFTRINAQPGLILTFQKQSNASTADLTDEIHTQISRLESEYPGLQIRALMDQGDYIGLITGNVISNLLWGGLLAILILLLFLKDPRPTAVIALSIPVSLMFAITLMYFSGVTLNIISLSGLALGVGMLVDNSIVVIENIYRLRHQQISATRAAVIGGRQVTGAILASTLTTICVFLPIVFTQGMSRDLFTDMGLTIAFSLIASLLVALTVVPAMSATLLRSVGEKDHRLFNRMVERYAQSLRFSLKHRYIVIIIALVLLAVSIYGVTVMGFAFIPAMDSQQMSLTATVPDGLDNEEKTAFIDDVTERILSIEAVDYVGALSGGAMFGGGGFGGGGESSEMSYYILLKDQRDLTNLEVEALIYDKTADLGTELSVTASTMDMSALGGSGVQLLIKGNDLDQLAETAADLTEQLRQVEGTTQVEWDGEFTGRELRVTVDRDAAMRHQLTTAQIFQQVAAVLNQTTAVTTLRQAGEEELPVLIINPDYAAITVDTLLELELTATGRNGETFTVTLDEIAEVREAASPQSISRVSQVRTTTVSAQIAQDYNIRYVSRDIEQMLETVEIPAGFTVELTGENETIMESMNDLILVLLLAILFIYLIMVAQFQSLLSPLIILFTIPLAFTGGLLLLWLLGFDLSIIAMLGFLVLSGIVVNNGIVFISTINQLREDGMERMDAIITAGTLRIRPILMTAMTTILAMSTLAIGVGDGAELTQPMAVVTIGGLTYATLLTLYIMPVLYSALHRRELRRPDLDDLEPALSAGQNHPEVTSHE